AEVRSSMEQDRLIQKIARYHPSWERGSVHVEESLRGELRRLRFGGTSTPDILNNPLPPRNNYGQSRANNGYSNNYAPRQDGNGRGTFPNGYNNNRRWNAPQEPPPVIAPDATADPKAERTVLRAFFSEEWTQVVQDRVRPTLFSDARAVMLVDRTLPLMGSGQLPAEAINRAAERDPELAEFADNLLLSDDEEPLSLQAIDDCLLYLVERQGKRQARNLSQQIEENRSAQKQNKVIAGQEGKSGASEEELLRQWQNSMEALKRAPTGDSGSKGS
ncbi:MAG: hypothetical protein H7145_02075, partial [Akkermansiaceae bacterium]|nr:hypothetical protein [Armatimonadota bacterium]